MSDGKRWNELKEIMGTLTGSIRLYIKIQKGFTKRYTQINYSIIIKLLLILSMSSVAEKRLCARDSFYFLWFLLCQWCTCALILNIAIFFFMIDENRHRCANYWLSNRDGDIETWAISIFLIREESNPPQDAAQARAFSWAWSLRIY